MRNLFLLLSLSLSATLVACAPFEAQCDRVSELGEQLDCLDQGFEAIRAERADCYGGQDEDRDRHRDRGGDEDRDRHRDRHGDDDRDRDGADATDCQERCTQRARRAHRRCVAEGVDEATCGARARALAARCIDEHCEDGERGDRVDHARPCRQRCRLGARQAVRRCIEDTGDEEACRARGRAFYGRCVDEHCEDRRDGDGGRRGDEDRMGDEDGGAGAEDDRSQTAGRIDHCAGRDLDEEASRNCRDDLSEIDRLYERVRGRVAGDSDSESRRQRIRGALLEGRGLAACDRDADRESSDGR
jgi:hypothetical protein